MSLTPMTNSESPEDPSKANKEKGGHKTDGSFRLFGVLLAIGLIIGTGEGIYAWHLASRLQQVQQQIQAQIAKQDENMHQLRDRLGTSEGQYTDLEGDLASTKNHLGKTQGDLLKARQMADQLAKQQKETAEHLTGQLTDLQQTQASTVGAVGSLSTDVTGVKQEVSQTKQDLASTRSDLQRVVGDMGVQSGLVAHNRDEIGELRRLGERDYAEFDVRKANQPQKFANGIALQLRKTDVKRQKYTVDLISDDRRIEKKDKNTNEPVQFYQQGNKIPTEIVVNQIYKDRIVGYISMPKQREARAVGPQGGAQPSGSGS